MNNRFRCGLRMKAIIDDHYKRMNNSSLQYYMTFSYLPGESTFYNNILKLMPGHSMYVHNGEIHIKQYDSGTSINKYVDKTIDKSDKLESLIEDSISKICEGEEREAFLLSSGVDSNYLFAKSNVSNAYSVGFTDVDYDESGDAVENSLRLNKKCERVIITPREFFDSVKEGMINLEQPIGTAASIAFMIGCKRIQGKVDVLYTGEGADEIFAGYDTYFDSKIYEKNAKYIGKAVIFTEEEKRAYLNDYNDSLDVDKLVEKYIHQKTGETFLQYMMRLDRVLWMEGNSLLNSYCMSRNYGIEIRMPFLDERIVDYTRTLPDECMINDKCNKVILRDISSRVLPKDVSAKPKKGFVIPVRRWLADTRYNGDLFCRFNGKSASYFFNVRMINRLLEDFCDGDSNLWRKVWAIYTFLVWHEVNFDFDGNKPISRVDFA